MGNGLWVMGYGLWVIGTAASVGNSERNNSWVLLDLKLPIRQLPITNYQLPTPLGVPHCY